MKPTNEEIEQARELVDLLEKDYSTKGYLGVNIDTPFSDYNNYSEDYTIIDSIFENVIDEIMIQSENLKYDEEFSYELSQRDTKRHIKTLKKFINIHAKEYFSGTKLTRYMSEVDNY